MQLRASSYRITKTINHHHQNFHQNYKTITKTINYYHQNYLYNFVHWMRARVKTLLLGKLRDQTKPLHLSAMLCRQVSGIQCQVVSGDVLTGSLQNSLLIGNVRCWSSMYTRRPRSELIVSELFQGVVGDCNVLVLGSGEARVLLLNWSFFETERPRLIDLIDLYFTKMYHWVLRGRDLVV
jgi:hypothetical protein